MAERLLPAKAHTLAAAVEDQLRVWNTRDAETWHRRVSEAGKAAIDRTGDLIVELQQFRDGLLDDLIEYDRQHGA